MASESEDFELRFKDGISPGVAAAKAVLNDFEKQAKAAGDAVEDTGDAAKDAGDKVGSFAEGVGSLISGIGGGVTALFEFGKAVWDKAILPAVEAHDHIAKLEAQFTALAGSKIGGEGALQTIDAMRDKFGMTREELAPLAKELLAINTPAKDFQKTMEALASQKALGLGGETAVINLLTKVSEHAKIGSKTFLSLAKDAGVSSEQIAAKMGLSVKQLKQQLEAGKVNVDAFRSAIVDLSKERGLEASEAQAKSFDYQWAKVKEDFADSFAKMDTKPLIEAVKHLGEMAVTAGPQLAHLFETAIRLGADFLGVIDKVEQGLNGLSGGYTGVTAGAEDVLGAEAKGMTLAQQKAALEKEMGRERFNNITGVTEKTQQAYDNLLEAMKDQQAHGEVEIENANKHVAKAQTPEQLAAAIKEQMKGIGDVAGVLPFQDVANDAQKAGQNAADGMAAGMKAGEGKVFAAGYSMGKAGIAGADAAQQSHSPAKEYEKRGGWAGEGFVGGVEKATPDAQAAVVAMVAPPAMPAWPAMATTQPQGANAPAPVHFEFNNCTFSEGMADVRMKLAEALDEARRAAA